MSHFEGRASGAPDGVLLVDTVRGAKAPRSLRAAAIVAAAMTATLPQVVFAAEADENYLR